MVLIVAAVRTGRVLFHHDRVTRSRLSNLTSTGFHPAEITGLTGLDPGLRRCIDRDEDHVCSGDGGRHVSGEMQVPSSRPFHKSIQPQLINRQLAEVGIPGIDAPG